MKLKKVKPLGTQTFSHLSNPPLLPRALQLLNGFLSEMQMFSWVTLLCDVLSEASIHPRWGGGGHDKTDVCIVGGSETCHVPRAWKTKHWRLGAESGTSTPSLSPSVLSSRQLELFPAQRILCPAAYVTVRGLNGL